MNKYLLFFICLTFLIVSCSKTKDSAPSTEAESLISGIKIAESESNQYQWDLNSKKAGLNEKKGTMTFVNPDLKFYKENKVASIITADKGELNLNTRDTVLTNNVIVNSKNEDSVLKTKKLLFSAAKKKIWTEEKVTVYRQNTIVTGVGLTANPDLSEIEIRNQETQLKTK
ncbi:MAG: LPS export ABC transporter periplasmic protein LptC [Elusimicrobiales bacterium]|nr:LPS export ABC transporter periplasmic protein LptC [Elusimicrobiales bacterium]MCK5106373.1 LPS export ABC transporter periplasmic protein LptC [Elusimicrobiales bacterium]